MSDLSDFHLSRSRNDEVPSQTDVRWSGVGVHLVAGTILGGYEVVRLIGSGGMGTVYEALQNTPRRSVALKVIPQSASAQKRDRRVAIVSMSFLERVDRLLQIEAALEAEAAKKALEEFQQQGGKAMEELARELNIE